jgi:hypothetical protein
LILIHLIFVENCITIYVIAYIVVYIKNLNIKLSEWWEDTAPKGNKRIQHPKGNKRIQHQKVIRGYSTQKVIRGYSTKR